MTERSTRQQHKRKKVLTGWKVNDIQGDNHLNLMIYEVIEIVEGKKLKNQKQADIRDFLK